MNIPLLTPAAELYIDVLQLNQNDKDKIRQCILR